MKKITFLATALLLSMSSFAQQALFDNVPVVSPEVNANHTSGGGNWNNWNLCVSTDDERAGGNYSEYFVIRSDAFGWGGSYASGKWDNEGYPANDDEWAEFRQNMEGAKVNMTISRSGTDIKVVAVETCTNGKVYIERFTAPCSDANEMLRAFLIVDGSYLVMDPAACYIGKPLY